MDIFLHLDKYTILQKLLLILFILFYYVYTKLTFISLLVEFEKIFKVKNKYLFFLLSFLFIFIGSIFFFYFLLLMLGFADFELLVDNLNLFFSLNVFTALYCFRKLFWYTTIGSLSLIEPVGEQILENKKKLKHLKVD